MAEPAPNTISFDEATYQKLIQFIVDCTTEFNDKFLKAGAGIMLNGTLKTYLRPGSTEWKAVEALLNGAGTFGSSTETKFTALSKEWGTFSNTLTEIMTTLKKSNADAIDLASIPAGDLLTQFPGLAPGTE